MTCFPCLFQQTCFCKFFPNIFPKSRVLWYPTILDERSCLDCIAHYHFGKLYQLAISFSCCFFCYCCLLLLVISESNNQLISQTSQPTNEATNQLSSKRWARNVARDFRHQVSWPLWSTAEGGGGCALEVASTINHSSGSWLRMMNDC